MLGFDEFMARARDWPVERAAAACGLHEDQIRKVAQWMAEADPLVFAPGNVFSASQSAAGFLRFNVSQCNRPKVYEVLQRAMEASAVSRAKEGARA